MIADWQKLKIIIPIFVLLTAINFYFSIYKPKSQVVIYSDPKDVSEHSAALEHKAARSVASINPVKTINMEDVDKEFREVVQFETELKLNCKDLLKSNFPSASVSSNHVMLKLGKCTARDLAQAFRESLKSGQDRARFYGLKDVDLMNVTNGYKAQLFKQGDESMNSDFIQLDKGENVLEFSIRLNDGQTRTQTFKINRIQ